MLAHLLLILLLSPGTLLSVPAPGDSQSPFNSLVGAWSATRTAPDRNVSLTRRYDSVLHNQRLVVTERIASDFDIWGMVSFDKERRTFVLKRFHPDGSTAELVLEQPNDADTFVFTTETAVGSPAAERVTHERRGSNEFVERIEAAAAGQPMTVVSETVFRRKR